jgi:hypothetical protein
MGPGAGRAAIVRVRTPQIGYNCHMQAPRKPNLARLMSPVPWRPALQIGDAGYPMPKPVLRDLIATAQRPR